ncbi:YolD-like family protein [Paenibacillus sp. YIM B09110]|uniref:YolD-like family protein n=1 Tax=Paenibacillus sp. YIM B09110 TaxID=3126102 RepID=UPI00301DEB03
MASKGPKRPTRDEFQMEELGERLVEAQREEIELLFTVWNWNEQPRGIIVKMDPRTKLVHVEYEGELMKIPFMDIMQVENPY